jgi:transcriptional regulator of arginine metabolism
MHAHAQFHGSTLRAIEDRREALKRIIRDEVVGKQSDLVRLLKRVGYPVTQSSVSRDLRDLGVAKIGDRYVLTESASSAVADLAAVADFVRDVVTAGPHLTVVRTTVGSAPTVAAALDRAAWPEIVGTISGDDTIFVATADRSTQRALLARLRPFQSR